MSYSRTYRNSNGVGAYRTDLNEGQNERQGATGSQAEQPQQQETAAPSLERRVLTQKKKDWNPLALQCIDLSIICGISGILFPKFLVSYQRRESTESNLPYISKNIIWHVWIGQIIDLGCINHLCSVESSSIWYALWNQLPFSNYFHRLLEIVSLNAEQFL